MSVDQKAENEKVFAEAEKKLADAEAAENAAKVAAAKKFDVKALAENTRKTHVIVDPKLGEIQYGILSRREVKELHLEKVTAPEEVVDRIVYAMLHKADPELTQDDLDALPFDAKAALLNCLTKVFTSFLSNPLPTGLPPTAKRS
jgi:hypothetical protein